MMLTVLLCLATAIVVGAAAWIWQGRRTQATRNQLTERLHIIEQSLTSAGAGHFVTDLVEGVITSSSTATRLRGLPPETQNIDSEQFWQTIHPSQRAEVKKTLATLTAASGPYTFEYRVNLPNDEVRWLRSHALPIKNEQGITCKVYGALFDVTATKTMEADLRAREDRSRAASIAAKFFPWELDLDTNIYTLDRPVPKILDAMGNLTGGTETYTTTVDAALAQTHEEDRHLLVAAIAAVQRGESRYEVESRSISMIDGTHRWHISSGRLVKDPTGNRRIVRGIIQDIHSRKTAEVQLQAMQARLDRTMRGTNDGLWELDLATGTQWISERFAEMLGYPAVAELLKNNKDAFGITHSDDLEAMNAAVARTLKNNELVDVEIRKKTKSGEWRWYRVRGAAERDASGKALTLSGSLQDVTEKRQYQQALIEAMQSAAAANKAKSEFLANMSHEIRTPMNGVIGMTELLLETPMNPMQRDYAETVRSSAAGLLTVINDILDFSKVEAGKLDLEILDMDIRDTVEDVARLLAIQGHAKGLEVMALLDPSLPDLMRGDAGRLRQILLNLGGNAIKFTHKGEVSIDCKVLVQDAASTLIRFEIRDTGIGIPANRQSALFQPFTQVDASTTRNFGGTGLGLSIVKRIVELMGGEVGITSEEGTGSIFWFTMRFGIAQHANKAQAILPAALKGQRVLVVDDNATNRKVIMGQLMLCATEPVCASSADEALALMRQAALAGKPFEVALLDHQMPGWDGAKLGKEVVADDSLKSTRLILLTSSGQRGDGHLFADIGFAGYLLKPVTQRDLVDCLMMVLSAQAEAWHGKSQPIITRHALRTQRAQKKHRLLLAEDNVVNQKVACRTLEKLGYRVDVAVDGQATVEAWATGRYDLILMDCQMPVLDGYEATRQIRERENGAKHIPIIALTAHAMKGADEACVAVGMDDYLAKPIDRTQLLACLEKWLEIVDKTEANLLTLAAKPEIEQSHEDPVDWDKLIKATDHDHELARELATLFIDSGLSNIETIVSALNTRDYGRLGEKAHELKGASANLQAGAASAAAERLEIAARNGDADQVPELAASLQREVERAIDFLRERVA